MLTSHARISRTVLEACERIDPENEALYRKVVHECVAAILGDEASAEVFLFALDGLLADKPSMEALEQRVQVVVVERGAVRTEMPDRAIATAHEVASTMTPEQRQRYGRLVRAGNAQTACYTKSGLPADAAAKVIAKAVTARKPRTRYTIGREAALLTIVGIVPDRILDFLFAAALRSHFPKESK